MAARLTTFVIKFMTFLYKYTILEDDLLKQNYITG